VSVGVYREFEELMKVAIRVERSLVDSDRRESMRQKRSGQDWSEDGPSNRMARREGSFLGSFIEPPQSQGSGLQRGQGQTMRVQGKV
jgi:hypothetical protein